MAVLYWELHFNRRKFIVLAYGVASGNLQVSSCEGPKWGLRPHKGPLRSESFSLIPNTMYYASFCRHVEFLIMSWGGGTTHLARRRCRLSVAGRYEYGIAVICTPSLNAVNCSENKSQSKGLDTNAHSYWILPNLAEGKGGLIFYLYLKNYRTLQNVTR